MLVRLDNPPNGTDVFFWSDFAELRALTHADKCFSRGDLAQVARIGTPAEPLNHEERWRSLIDFCGIRRREFGVHYPFSVSADNDTLELSLDNNSPGQRLYLGLLIAASLRHVPKTRMGGIARNFEKTCFSVFSRLVPKYSEIRATWANGGSEAPYTGHLYEKMIAIAKDIRGNPDIHPSDFKINNTGDGGIDLIAWHSMGDTRPGIPIAFAQCGCSRDDWTFKQAEASPFLHRNHFRVMHDWATYYFMPLDLRESDGHWAYKSKIGQAILVDRLRLVRLVDQYSLYEDLPDFPCVEEALTMAET
ncbi:hypothetical protein [Dechloromonas denitrificans]|uniref:hypothetical protein n=1 Tax=Dechloromonas denitrificans TaxID=281362 RepID=UPI001CFA53EC|nr:hypothetical protein [Dechloromonas denitrificans]UCV09415.1 hypothetical protein KI615_07835 [Dechloromonas denitrificans]